jgi:hypothetical protein
MADQDIRLRAVVEDDGSAALDKQAQAMQKLKDQTQGAASAADTFSSSMTQVEEGSGTSAAAVEQLYSRIRELVEGGSSLDEALSDVASSLEDFYSGGYSAEEAAGALGEALSRIELEAGNLGGSLADAAGGMSDLGGEAAGAVSPISEVEEALAGVEDAASGIASIGPEAGSAISNITGGLTDMGGAAGGASEEGGGLLEMFGLLGTTATISTGKLGGLKNVAQELAQKVGLAKLAAGGGAFALYQLGTAAADEEVSVSSLDQTIRINIGTLQDYSQELEEAESWGQKLAFSDDEVRASLNALIPFTKDMGDALRIQSVAADLARFKNMDLASASELLVRGMINGGSAFRRMGIDIREGASAMEVLQAVEAKFSGQAERYANTTASSFDRLTTSAGNLLEVLGGPVAFVIDNLLKSVNSVVTVATYGFDDLGRVISDAFDGSKTPEADLVARHEAMWGELRSIWGNGAEEAQEEVTTTIREVTDEMEAAGVTWADLGYGSGSEYMGGAVSGVEDGQDDLAVACTVNGEILDTSSAANATGQKIGSGYTSSEAAGVSSTRGALSAEVGKNNAVLEEGIKKLNRYRAMMGLGAYPSTGIGPPGPPASIANADRSYDSIEGIRSGAGRNTVPLAQQQANLDKLRDDYIKKYGTDPRNNAPIEPKKAKGGGGRSPEEERARLAFQQAELELQKKIAAARGEVEGATESLAEVTARYTDELDRLNGSLDDIEDQEEADLGPLEKKLDDAQEALADFRVNSEDMMEPLIEEVEKAGDALEELRAEAVQTREAFQDQRDELTDALDEIDAAQERAFEGRDTRIRELSDALYDLAAAERTEIGALDEAIRSKSLALDAEKKAVEELARSYDEQLRPKRERLAELDEEERKDERSEGLKDQALTVENLTARLKNLSAGSREYNQLLAQRDKAVKELQRGQERAGLEDEVASIEKQKAAALEEAQAKVEAMGKELEKLQQTREERQHDYEVRRALMEEEQAALERKNELEGRLFEEQRKRTQEGLDLLNRQEELFNRQQRDKETAAQEDLEAAEGRLQGMRDTIAEQEKVANESIRLLQKEIDDKREKYGELKKQISDQIESVKERKKEEEEAAKVIVDEAKKVEKAYKDQLAQAQLGNKESQIAADLAKIERDAREGSKKAVEETTPKMQELADKTKAASDNSSTLANTLNRETGPAMQGMKDKAGPAIEGLYLDFEKYLSPFEEKGMIMQMIFGRDGFFDTLGVKWGSELDWVRVEVMNAHWDLLRQDMLGVLEKMRSQGTERAKSVGGSIGKSLLDGIAGELRNITVHGTFTFEGGNGDQPPGDNPPSPPDSGTPTYPQAEGGDYLVTRPTLFLAGEAGMERATFVPIRKAFAPAGGRGGRGGGGGDILIDQLNFSPVFPAARQLPTDAASYEPAARAMLIAIRNEKRRSGLSDS